MSMNSANGRTSDRDMLRLRTRIRDFAGIGGC